MLRTASDPVRAVLLAAVLVGAYMAASSLVTVVLTLVVTLIVALPLLACADFFERHGLPRVLGAVLGVLALLAALIGALALLVPTFAEQAQRFVDEVPDIIRSLRGDLREGAGDSEANDVGQTVAVRLQEIIDEPQRLLGPAASIGLGVAGVLASAVLVLMTAFYIAAHPRPLYDGFLSLFPDRRQEDVRNVLSQIKVAWWGWLRGMAVDVLVTGVLLYVGLRIIDLDFALVFAVLSALLVVVPYLGAIAGGIPPILYAFADSPTKAAVVAVVYLAVQQIEGNLIVPMVMSRTVSLHPALIVAGVVVVGTLFGFLGLFVAVPIIAAVGILVRELYVEPLRRDDRRRSPPEDAAGLRPHTSTGGVAAEVTTTVR